MKEEGRAAMGCSQARRCQTHFTTKYVHLLHLNQHSVADLGGGGGVGGRNPPFESNLFFFSDSTST